MTMATPTSFKISIPDSEIEELNSKLSSARFPKDLDSASWSMGSPLQDIKRLTTYWHKEFSWRKAESHLNTFPQFTVPITIPGFEELEIHFIHARSKRENAIPLLFIHGWPGSYFEVLKLLPLLTDSSDPNIPSFHVVAPSLPNFAWSQGPRKKGFGLTQYAQVLHSVMQSLNYKAYVTQGGDWGGFLSRLLSRLYPSSVKAVHTNFPVHSFPKPWLNPIVFLQTLAGIAFNPQLRAGLAHTQRYLSEGDGYLKIQDTKPQTLSYGLTDSPVGLLAWIYEKLHDWTDNYPWTDEEVCIWVSIYYFSREGPGASTRIYYESTHPPPPPSAATTSTTTTNGGQTPNVSRTDVINSYIPRIPFALAYFPKELTRLPLSWAWTNGKVVQQSIFEVGGHFAAWEVPELLAGDLRKLFGRRGPCDGVIEEATGF